MDTDEFVTPVEHSIYEFQDVDYFLGELDYKSLEQGYQILWVKINCMIIYSFYLFLVIMNLF